MIGDLPKKAAFKATRLTQTTFKIVEYNDIYSEHPFIYAKLFPALLLLLDTGCGGATNDPDVDLRQLRLFLETHPVDENSGEPLNKAGTKKYVVVCSHCHFDHILGVEQFSSDSLILASSHSPSFLSSKNIGKHSLCERLGILTPAYTPTLIDHLSYIAHVGVDTGMQVLHTPGHTPDELALWDETERMLYVGDTLYEWSPIIFPPQGSIVDWFASVDMLIRLVKRVQSMEPHGSLVKINSGHDTSMGDALNVLTASRSFINDVIGGKEKVKKKQEIQGVTIVYYERNDRRFSLRCPESLVEDARQKLHF
ncbi:Metallo-hydrolase/oxidoreductase [Rickenella mellea]|uniref:Metallo-hydrolase/oxidoreductase n=1 Tax=Rickenella mellea TaxID=50990 RepID=A0A4Y7QF81_9AGAM|nr:Metallo-hydrolase/oxidoreductase [Rickenella mellea]